jgi:tetratricopeptide (TPR) repeat protein
MASVEHQMGNLRSAWAFTLEAHAHAQLAGDLDTEFSCNINRVSHFITAGNYQRASALATDLISLAKGLGIENSERGLTPLVMMGEIHLRKSEYDEARRMNQILAETLRREDETKAYYALSLRNTFLIDVCMGKNITHESIDGFRRLRNGAHWVAICDLVGADLFQRQGALACASELYTKCLTVARGQWAETTNECFQRLGDNAAAWSRMDLAHEYYVLHLVQSRKMDDYENTHQALRRLGDTFFYYADDETARSLFTLSLEAFTLMDIHRARADCLFGLGQLWKRAGDISNAARHWQQALPLFERSSQQHAAHRCKVELASCN